MGCETAILDGDRGIVWDMGDGWTGYRPSAIGKCLRALVAARLGLEAKPHTQAEIILMNEGNIHEPHVQNWWEEKAGGKIWREKERLQVRLNAEGYKACLMGTCDGIWVPDEDSKWFRGEQSPWGIEVKAQDISNWEYTDEKGPSHEYLWQLSTYWAGIEETHGFKLAGYIFLYKNRQNGLIRFKVFRRAPVDRSEIISKVGLVEMYHEMGFEFFEQIDCDIKDYFCRYWHLHKASEKDEEIDEELEPIAAEYTALNEKTKEIEKRMNRLKFDAKIGLRDRKKVRTETCRVQWIEYKPKVDVEMMIHDNPKLQELIQAVEDEKQRLAGDYMIPGTRFVKIERLDSRRKKKEVKGATPEQVEAMIEEGPGDE